MSRAPLRSLGTAVVGMVIVWLLLWGTFGWFTLIGGVLLAAVILAVFPLPPIVFGNRVSSAGVIVFVAWFLRDLVAASAQIAWLAVRPGPPPRGAIIAVRLRAGSGLHLTLTAEAVSLIPGSLIVEVDPERATLYVHVLGVTGPDGVSRARADIRAVEARLIRAVGTRADRRTLDAEEARP